MSRQESNLSVDEKEFYSFLIVPAVPAAIFSASSLGSGSLLVSSVIFIGAYFIAGVHVLLLGVPIFLLGKRLNAIRWWSCTVAAFLIGGLPMGIWDDWHTFIPFALFGASGGFGFWLLWEFWIHSGR